MLFVTLDDGTGRVEVSLRGETIDAMGHMIVKDEVLVVDGDISPDDFNGGFKIRSRELYDMGAARARFARQLVIRLSANDVRERGLDELLAALAEYKSGVTPVCFVYDNDQARARIRAGNRWAVTPRHELIAQLEELIY